MYKNKNPLGDGKGRTKIAKILKQKLNKNKNKRTKLHKQKHQNLSNGNHYALIGPIFPRSDLK